MFKLSRVLLLSLLVVCVASVAFATTSRVAALAGTSNYINDDSNVFRWYGTLPSYANLVMAEAGQGSADGSFSGVNAANQALGFTYAWAEDSPLGTWGIFLLSGNLNDGSFFAFNPLTTSALSGVTTFGLGVPGTTAGTLMPATKFVVGWGNEMEKLSYGIMFTRSDASLEVTAPAASSEESVSFTTLGGGIRSDLGDKAYLDVAVTYGTAGGDSIGPGGGGDKFDSSNAFDIAGRLFYEWRDNITMVPYLDFQSFEYSANSIPATQTNGVKGSDLSVGVSFNMDVNTSNMLIFATQFRSISFEPATAAAGDQSDVDITTLPTFFLAVESDVNSWLTTRVGATKTMTKTETTNAAGSVTTVTGNPFTGAADFAWFLGAGFHVGDWDIDTLLSQDTPFRLGYWLTGFGTGDTTPPVGRISGTYRF